MPRANRVLHAAERGDRPVADTLILPHAQRQAQKGFLFGVKGTCVEIDFAEPVRLRTDDALVLDDGGLIDVGYENMFATAARPRQDAVPRLDTFDHALFRRQGTGGSRRSQETGIRSH